MLKMQRGDGTIVVVAGPCGCFAAFKMAQKGLDVDVFEEHRELGLPSHCAGHVSIKGLRDLGLYPLPNRIVENVFRGASFFSPCGRSLNIRFANPVTCAVNRELFDKYLGHLAESAGARVNLGCRVEALTVEEGFASGILFENKGRIETKSADVVVDAEGVSSRLLRQFGLPILNRDMTVMGVEAEVDNCVDVIDDEVEVFVGAAYAPCFYGWLIPRHDGSAKVGLASKGGNPLDYLQRLMRKHPVASKQLSHAKVLSRSVHPISLGGPIPSLCGDGFVAVGDVASQVKPTTGGGVILGLNCASIVSEVVKKASGMDDFSIEQLSEYQRRCSRLIGFDMRVMQIIRNTLNELSDRRLDDLILFCSRFHVDEALGNVSDLDLQGRGLLGALLDPRMLVAVGYFLLICLSTNP
jgi:digeranylgeranylglycerophospholipid reductase